MKRKIPQKIKKAINETIKNISALYLENLDKIILYGSFARGDFSDNSDIDLLISLKKMNSISDERNKYINTTSKISLKYDTVISILPVETDQYNKCKIPIFINIHKEGIPL